MLTDSRGTAWFVLREPGRYRARLSGAPGETCVFETRPAELSAEPGYGHIHRVSLGN